jgi:hypothetical protein
MTAPGTDVIQGTLDMLIPTTQLPSHTGPPKGGHYDCLWLGSA